MRNLKRVLSLALASAMLFGMMVVGASAADKTALTDLDKVVNKEAVTLMVDLGIIVGKPDGTFAPTETVDRATMAKLITYIMMGNVDASLFEGTVTDLKDIESNWAKGYIKYCYANNIITGDGMGSFFPGNKVTVVQAAKMLLVAIGYDSETQGYVGNNWSVNIMKDAKTSGLLAGLSASTNDELTRDNAAQMIYNALFSRTITYTTQYDGGKAYKVDPSTSKNNVPNPTLGQLQYSLAKAIGPVDAINSDGTPYLGAVKVNDIAKGDAAPVAVSAAMGKLAASVDMVGGNVVAYFNTDSNKLYSTALTIGAVNVIGTVTGGIASAAVYTNITTRGHKDFVAETEASPKFFLNGKSVANANSVKVGAIVEFVDQDGSNKAEVVRITEKKVATLNADPILGTNSTGDAVVTIGSLGLSKVKTSNVKGYEDLKKDDVVLYYQLGSTYYIEKAEAVEAATSGKNSAKGLLINGTYYLTSGLDGASIAGWTEGDFTNTYAFYLDNGKNIVKAVKKTDAATSANYAILADVAFVQGSGVGATNYVEAKLVFGDGSTEVVKIATVNGAKVAPAGGKVADLASGATFYLSGATAAAVDGATTTAVGTDTTTAGQYYKVSSGVSAGGTSLGKFFAVNTASAKASIPTGQFYEFTKNSAGNYELKNTNFSNKVTMDDLAGKITSNTAKFDTNSVANANTVFIFDKTDSAGTVTYTTYTGIANVPSTTAISTNVTNTIVKNADGVALYVFVKGSITTTASKDYVYITSADETTSSVNGTTCYINDAIVKGEKAAGGIKLDNAGYTVGLYTVVSIDANGIYTLSNGGTSQSTTPLTMVSGIKSIGGGTIQFANAFATKTAYTYDDDSVAYVIDADGNCTQSSIEGLALSTSNQFYLTTTSATSDKIDTIYVVLKAATAPTAVTLASGTTNGATTLGATDLLAGAGAVTAWTATTADTIKVSVTPAAGYSVKSINIDGTAKAYTGAAGVAADFDNYALTADGKVTVTVGIADDISGTIEVYSYTINVSGKV